MSQTRRVRGARRVTPGAAPWLPVLLLPVTVGLVLVYFSAVYGLTLGFTDWDLISSSTWVGTENFAEILDDDRFWKALRNTLQIVAVTVPGKVAIGLGLAILLSRIRRLSSFFRLALFFPTSCSVVAVAFLWVYLYDPNGLFNSWLSALGFDAVKWMSPDHALTSVNVMIIWGGVGYVALLFLAGLQSIPTEYYEASRLDGASAWRQFWSITFPLLTPTTFFVVVTGIITSLQTFGEVFILAGPMDSTLTITSYIYERAFTGFEMGYSAALSAFLILILLAATCAQLWFQRKWVTYER
ncbi:carbohydrate ABC transporter permease [Dactylosporangium fulvum]|uniref:Sugar ABC transporter permease n=1 Tax=Dactylosporangium fulvum TaxID=53359 RepID=A0ABY5WAP2_9ACTN|nr:sugar ABC transporter permease [Dactylosporangium fulvum]UWP86607.1 sugar ABC transporter permease [Dactylosporangium fulvum]